MCLVFVLQGWSYSFRNRLVGDLYGMVWIGLTVSNREFNYMTHGGPFQPYFPFAFPWVGIEHGVCVAGGGTY